MSNIEHRPQTPIPSFDEIKSRVASYLEQPVKSNDLYDLVNGYFGTKWGLNNWNQGATKEAEEILSTLRAKMDLPQDSAENLKHDRTFGAIAYGLPYYYPLNLNVLGWLVYGEMERSEGLDPSEKEKLAGVLTDKAEKYDPFGYDLRRNKEIIERRLMPREKPKTAKASVLQKLNPFRSKS